MITLYYDLKSKSSKLAIEWFDKYKVKINKKDIKHIKKEELIDVLSASENGFFDILKNSRYKSTKTKKLIRSMQGMSFNESIDFLSTHSEIIRTPIMIENGKVLIGYNTERVRIFLSKEYRQTERKLEYFSGEIEL